MERLIGLAFDWVNNQLQHTYLVLPFPVAPKHLVTSLGLTRLHQTHCRSTRTETLA